MSEDTLAVEIIEIADKAQTQVNEIIEATSPRAATPALRCMQLINEDVRGIRDCLETAERGTEPGTFRHLAWEQADRVQERVRAAATEIARGWNEVCGETPAEE